MTMLDGHWYAVKDGDARASALYLRHYSAKRFAGRDSRAVRTFCGPGEQMVLLTQACDALFVWRLERFRKDNQTGINCAIFRNEGPTLSSLLIEEACQMAWQRWPGERLFTFVWDAKIRSANPGYCFKRAGWKVCGRNADGRLTILERAVAVRADAVLAGAGG